VSVPLTRLLLSSNQVNGGRGRGKVRGRAERKLLVTFRCVGCPPHSLIHRFPIR